MLPPRYLLREDVVVRQLRGLAPRRIVEIGCGAGELLARLGELGYAGVGYDPSAMAREHARARLERAHCRSFEIVDGWPERAEFDLVLLLEVLGYADDPKELLERCRRLLSPGGRILLSFARVGAGYDPRVVADMKFFARDEVVALLRASGFAEPALENYGFPLANALVGVNNAVYRSRLALLGRPLEVGETAVAHKWAPLRPLSLFSNRFTLKPFFQAQRLAAHTDLGNGYVVCAQAGG